MELKKESEYEIDLMPLYHALVANKIKCEMRLHPGFNKKAVDILGCSPVGKYQILIEKDGGTYSVIRGMASFGDYEIMRIKGESGKFEDPERFTNPEELLAKL